MMFMHMWSMLLYVICLLHVYVCYMFVICYMSVICYISVICLVLGPSCYMYMSVLCCYVFYVSYMLYVCYMSSARGVVGLGYNYLMHTCVITYYCRSGGGTWGTAL